MRNLEREIAKICRKAVKAQLCCWRPSATRSPWSTPRTLEKSFLGVQALPLSASAEENNEIGQVTGLAWTEVGGELLRIESTLVPGKGKLTQTGHLGDVMKESIQAAMTVVRSRAAIALGIEPGLLPEVQGFPHPRARGRDAQGRSQRRRRHVHRAGLGADAHPGARSVAMTGEITLRGEVLPIGGLKEKLLAAHRGGIEKVLIPEENEKDLGGHSQDHQAQARRSCGPCSHHRPGAGTWPLTEVPAGGKMVRRRQPKTPEGDRLPPEDTQAKELVKRRPRHDTTHPKTRCWAQGRMFQRQSESRLAH